MFDDEESARGRDEHGECRAEISRLEAHRDKLNALVGDSIGALQASEAEVGRLRDQTHAIATLCGQINGLRERIDRALEYARDMLTATGNCGDIGERHFWVAQMRHLVAMLSPHQDHSQRSGNPGATPDETGGQT